jgi:S-disulfanyl-L-cysteine oxidoreductase SoxD
MSKCPDVCGVRSPVCAHSREGGNPAQESLGPRLRGDERNILLRSALLIVVIALSSLISNNTFAAEKKLNIGREATAEEIAGWDIDIRPDGHGLPVGKGTVKQGEPLYVERCAACHGEFGESAGRWPILSGGSGTLASHDPVKSIGSYWPYASTLIDYIRRAMPFGAAQTLTNDELYAITAYVLFLNDIVTSEDFELSDKNFRTIKLPNEPNFFDDDREVAEKAFWRKDPCMKDCAAGVAAVTGRARVIDVTPEPGKGPKVE